MTGTTTEITDTQIQQLREEALAHGDDRLEAWCSVALAPRETTNDDGSPLVDFDGAPITRTAARMVCARAIDAARAMDDGPEVES